MKKPVAWLSALALGTAIPSVAAVCALDVAPASTLLLPFFEVDLSKVANPKKAEVTTVTLTNHSDAETLAHVTFWTDVALPVMAYDILIPPFGSQDIPLHEVFAGEVADLPGIVNPEDPAIAPPGATIEDVIARQTGQPINGNCLTFPRGDRIARGYITIDAIVNDQVFPNARRRNSHSNVLTGIVSYNNRRRKNGSLEYLVHLEATGSGTIEGLGSVWALDYDISNGARTEIIVWRDIADTQSFDSSAACDGPAPNGWFPHGQTQVTVADEAGSMQEILLNGVGESVAGFPYLAGRYEIGRGGISVPFKKGTLYLDLSDAEQSWVGVRRSFNSTKRQGRAQAVPIVPIECSPN